MYHTMPTYLLIWYIISLGNINHIGISSISSEAERIVKTNYVSYYAYTPINMIHN